VEQKDIFALFRKEANFVAGADKPQRLPDLTLPEFAFIGRSNVGKSSLINLLCNRRTLARVSHSPGRTQQINFFQIGEVFTLVDLPGYGFAKIPQSLRKSWEELILHYLSKRDNLAIVNLLIDSRRGLGDNDLKIIELLLKFNLKFQIVFTKSDKLTDKDALIKSSYDLLPGISVNFIFTSSRSKDGTEELQLSLGKFL
jgi:GTP-binding protein